MQVIKAELPTNIKTLELHTFADEHVGDENSDLKRLQERIEYVANTHNVYCILNGDIIDNATRSSIGDVEARELNIMQQIQVGVDLFEPIKDKILCITSGNHEFRTYRKEGVDISKIIAMQLGLEDRYAPASALIFVSFGERKSTRHYKPIQYSIFCNHGSGGGRKEGAKAIRLADMASIVDADVYIHSHTHLPMIMKQGFYRTSLSNQSVKFVDKLFVNTASNLSYGGYGEAQEYKPNSKDTPVIYLEGDKRKLSAKL